MSALLQPCDTETPDTTRDAKGRFASADPWVRIRQSEVSAMNDDLADADAGIAHLSEMNAKQFDEISGLMAISRDLRVGIDTCYEDMQALRANNRECLAALSAAQSEVKALRGFAKDSAKITDAVAERRTATINTLRAEAVTLRDSLAIAEAERIGEAWEWMAVGILMGAVAVGLIVAAFRF